MLLFGAWWTPLAWLSDKVLDAVQGAASKALRTVFFSFSTLIYKLVISLYNLFDILCYGRILDNEVLKDLSTRIGYVLGVIMLFFVILSFVNMLLNPDTLSDKNKGAANIIKKTILVIVMLGVSNYFFQLLYSVQRVVVQNHVVSKLLLPYEVDTEHFGGALSAELFTAFYNVSLSYIDSDGNIMGDDENVQLCQKEVYTMKEQIAEHSDFSLGDVCLNTSTTYTAADGEDREDFIIDFNWLLSVGVGIFAIYILTMYCIKVGIRMIQLAFLEIISPMAIVSYLSPKQDTMFSKWSKIYFSTYIDVFIRIAIINFSVYLIAVIFGSGTDKTFWESFEINGSNPIWTKRFIMIAMVLALLAFAKKAPELLKELLPAGASKLGLDGGLKSLFGISPGQIGGAFLGATTGSAVGMITAGLGREGLRNKLTGMAGGALTGLGRGAVAGSKGKHAISSAAKAQWGKMKDANMAYNNGATFSRRMATKISNLATGGQTLVPRLERQKAQLQRESNAQYKQNMDRLNRMNKSYNAISDNRGKMKKLMLDRLANRKSDAMNVQGASNVLTAQSKIANLEEQLRNTSDLNEQYKLQQQLTTWNKSLAVAQDRYFSNFYATVTDNAEYNSYKNAIGAEFNSNSDLYEGQNFSTWQGVDATSNYANDQISNNSTLITEYQAQLDQVNDQIAELDRQIENAKNDSGPIFGPPPGGPWGGPPPGGPGGRPPRP